MATPFVPRKKDVLTSMTSAGLIGSGSPAAGTQFEGKSDTGFVNAENLVAANAGKGQSMFDTASKDQIDSNADLTPLSELKSYDPNAHLKSTTTIGTATNKTKGVDAFGNSTETTTTTNTPTTTTTYDGLGTADIDKKKAAADSLKSGLGGLKSTYADDAAGVAGRNDLLTQKLAPNISTYNNKQAGFDSFLMEQEAQPAIANKRSAVNSLLTKFDGLDEKVTGLKAGIQSAQGKVGSVAGNTTTTSSAVLTTPKVTNGDGAVDPVKDQAVKDGFQITGKDGSISYYDKAGNLITKIQTPDSTKSSAEPNGGFAIKDAQGGTSHYDKDGNFLYKS